MDSSPFRSISGPMVVPARTEVRACGRWVTWRETKRGFVDANLCPSFLQERSVSVLEILGGEEG